MTRNIPCSLLLIVSAVLHAGGQDCKDFVVLDRYSSTSNYVVYEKVKDSICSNTIHDQSSARSAAGQAGIPIPLLDDVFSLKMSGNISADDWSHWQQQFCHSYYYEYQSQMQNSNLAQVFSDNAKSVVETCLNREPVYAYFDVSPSGDAFAFTFHVQGKDKLKKGFVRPGNAVRDCDIDNPFGLSWYYQNVGDLDISGERKAFACSWNSSLTARVELKLDNQGDRAYVLPPIIKRETPPPPPPLVVTPETYRSDNLPSGHCKDFSGMYNLCSAAKPDGWTIVSQRFQLTGDRACNAWSTCAQTVNTPTQACYQFSMQGHDEECGHSGNTGIHFSTGVLDVVWQHH